jgi:pimeloyl-ACP methyl ester carboxylesterase
METYKNLLIPTLNIYGNDDRVVNPVHSQTIANLRPVDGLNHILAYDGVGHIPMWENPKKFETDLDNWIKNSVLNPKHQKTPKAPKIPQPPPQPQQKRK